MGGWKGMNVNERNGQWKGDNVGYDGLHCWVRRRLPQPDRCEKCGEKKEKLDLANISQKYLRRLDDWEWLCRKCHMDGDGRMANLIPGWSGHPLKPCQRCGLLTNRIKWCEPCFREARKEWWRKYNATPKRIAYRKNRSKKKNG